MKEMNLQKFNDKVLKVDMTIKNNSKEEIPVGGDVKVYVDGKQAKSYLSLTD